MEPVNFIVRSCGPIPMVPNADRQEVTIPDGQSAVFGSTHSFSCHYGYKINGSTTVECQEDGTWTAAPVCEGNTNYKL